MADDANFVGGRLRLAAFLRVVETDMPQRPSRFKRRSTFRDLARESNPAEVSHIGDSSTLDASKQNRTLRASEGDTADEPTHPGAEFDLPRSRTTTDVDSGRQDESEFTCFKGQLTSAKPKKRAKSTKQVARIAKVKGASSIPQKISDTRRRRLPVNSLPLLRMTTCDGLPEPGVRSV